MPFSTYYWEHPLLKNYLREIAPGEVLFRQSEPGTSMFIVLSGILELTSQNDGVERIVSLIEPGDFLGERAIIQNEPFQRTFGARARSSARVLELSFAASDRIAHESPPLLIDILKGVFSVASLRLARANEMISILRSSNNEARLLSLLLYFAETVGVEGLQGIEVTLERSTIHYYVEMSETEIDATLTKWEDALLLSRGPSGCFVIFDEPALTANLRSLAEQPSGQAPV